MENISYFGRWLVIIGLATAFIGGILLIIGRIPGVGKLPGTLRIETSGVTCVFPILLSIVLSIGLTLALYIVNRLINH